MGVFHWLNGASGGWGSASDWDQGTVPGYNDIAIIDVSGTYAVTVSAPEIIQQLTLNAASATLDDQSVLTVGGTFDATAGTIDLAAGGGIVAGALGSTATLNFGAGSEIDHTAGSAQLTDDGAAGSQIISAATINASAAGGTLTVNPLSFINNGLIAVSNGDDLVLQTALTGVGTITLGTGGSAELAGTDGAGQTVAFSDSTGRLNLDNAAAFGSTIQGFVSGDTIDLAGVNATGAAWAGGVLTVTLANSSTLTLGVSGDYTGVPFGTAPDNHGGTDITVARVYAGSGTDIQTTEDSPFNGFVALITDSNTTDTASIFSAVIDWGDGTTSVASVAGGNGYFSVQPVTGHVFSSEGTYTASVTVTSSIDGVVTSADSTIAVTEADEFTVTAPPALNLTSGVAFNGAVATFLDADTAAAANEFAATIDWGDGITSAGTVVYDNGTITVDGSHTYLTTGSEAVSVTLADVDGTATATATGTAIVSVDGLTFDLTSGVDHLTGGPGNDTFVAATGTLNRGDTIDGAGGVNTLKLVGGGWFNLGAPTTLAVQVVSAQEGTGSAEQTVLLRQGSAYQVNVQSGPAGAGILIQGADNSDVITLGGGNDTVILGKGETAIGGGGNAIYKVNAETIQDTIVGGTAGTNTLVVGGGSFGWGFGWGVWGLPGGGTVGMGANISGITAVKLADPTNFVANATPGMTITGSAWGGDTITLGAASQSVIGGGAFETIRASAANAGALVTGLGYGSTLEITSGGPATLNAQTAVGTVKLDAATHLTLSGLSFITAVGSSSDDTIVAGATYQTLTGGGGADTLTGFSGGHDTFRDTAQGLNGDTIQGFVSSDKIDLTNIFSLGASVRAVASDGNTTVTVSSWLQRTTFTMAGSWSQSGFSLSSDRHGGLVLTHS